MIGHPNLKAWWRLDGNSQDSSGNGLNGTDTSITYNGATFGKGAALTPSGYISMGNVLGFETNQPHSIGAWLTGSQNLDSNLIGKQLNSGNYAGFGLGTRLNSGYQVYIYAGGPAIILSIAPIDAVNPHHIMYTYNGSLAASGVTVYVDGSPVAKTTWINNLSGSIINTGNFQINGRGGANAMWTGAVDDVQVYNIVLPQSDIRRIMLGKHPLTRS